LRGPVWPTWFIFLFCGSLAAINYLIMAYLDLFRPELLDAEVDDEVQLHG
jgi:hypothetical protein